MWPTRPTKGFDWCSFHRSLSVVQWDLRYIFHWDMLQFEAKECFSTETWHWSGWVVAFTESQGLKKKTALWWVSLLRNQAGVVLTLFTKLWDILQQIVYFRSSYIKDTSGKQTKITLKNFKTSSRQLTNLFGTASYPAVQRFVNHGFRVPKTSVGVRRWASKSLWHPSARKEDDYATICFVKPVVCQLLWIWAL